MQEFRFESLDLQIKGAENEHFWQKQEGKKMDLLYFERKFEIFFYVQMDKEKNLNVSKTKPVVPRGHPLLLLLFFQNKRCMHNEVGTCKEFLPTLPTVAN